MTPPPEFDEDVPTDATEVLHITDYQPCHCLEWVLSISITNQAQRNIYLMLPTPHTVCFQAAKKGPTEEELRLAEEAIAAPLHNFVKRAKTAEEIEFLQECLSKHVLFEEVPLDRLNEACHSMTETEIAAGDRLIYQGRKNDHFFVVNKGEFKLFKVHPPWSHA